MDTTRTTDPAASAQQLMPCMEVWGGNQAVDRGVVMLGLDAWLYARPYQGDAGGGDVHFVSSCATGRVTRVMVADVSGHGAEVAQTGDRLRQLMRRYVNHIDQTRFVVSLNHEFRQLTAEGRFATSVVVTFFAPTNALAVSNAGHPPPLLYRRRDRDWSLVEPARAAGAGLSDIPLGILDESRYEQQALRLAVGDLVLLYTDSLIEARGRDGRPLGRAGLLETCRGLDPDRPEGLLASLLGAIEAMAEANLRQDDVTALLVRPNGLSPRLPLAVRLKAPLRVMGGVLRSLAGRGGPAPWPELSVPSIGGAFFDRLNRGRGD